MTDFRLALAQINPTVGDLDGNTSRILSVMEEARALGADLVAFPELAVTGYPPEDLLLKPSFIRDNIEAMKRIVAASGDMAVVVGYADMDSDIYNAAAWATAGSWWECTARFTCPPTECSTRTATSRKARPALYTP